MKKSDFTLQTLLYQFVTQDTTKFKVRQKLNYYQPKLFLITLLAINIASFSIHRTARNYPCIDDWLMHGTENKNSL